MEIPGGSGFPKLTSVSTSLSTVVVVIDRALVFNRSTIARELVNQLVPVITKKRCTIPRLPLVLSIFIAPSTYRLSYHQCPTHTISHHVDPPRPVNQHSYRPMVVSAPGNRRHRPTCTGDRRTGCPRQHVWPAVLIFTDQVDQICLPSRLQRSSFQRLILGPGNARRSSRTPMDHGLHLSERHLGAFDFDVWLRPERLEGGGDCVQVHGVGRGDGYGRCGMARGAGREVGVSCCGDGYGCSDRIPAWMMGRQDMVLDRFWELPLARQGDAVLLLC